MYKKVTGLTAGLAAMALLFAVSSVQAAEESGGATATAEEMTTICKAQAAKRSLTGSEAEDYLKKCTGPISSEVERAAKPDEKQEGQL